MEHLKIGMSYLIALLLAELPAMFITTAFINGDDLSQRVSLIFVSIFLIVLIIACLYTARAKRKNDPARIVGFMAGLAIGILVPPITYLIDGGHFNVIVIALVLVAIVLVVAARMLSIKKADCST